MLILSIDEIPGKKVKKSKVRLQGGEDLCLYTKEVNRLGLEAGEDLSESAYEDILAMILIPRAKKRAMHLLEKQDRTKQNLSDKLRESGYPMCVVEAAVSYVESYHYIDDERYARNYIRYHQDGKSRRRIYEDLYKKGIAKDVIEIALEDEYLASEEDQIIALLEKKHYDASTADMKEKSRIYRFLLGRGFSYQTIDRILSKR